MQTEQGVSFEEMEKYALSVGFPTFEEFAKNTEKWTGTAEDLFSIVDQGGTALKGLLKRLKYRIMGYNCDSLVEVQRIMNGEGYKPDQFSFVGECLNDETAGRLTVVVSFQLKENSIKHEEAPG